jgi:phosphatidylserine/phosphatidylglycerophosphate/cardiolipin synthase-like enzyme
MGTRIWLSVAASVVIISHASAAMAQQSREAPVSPSANTQIEIAFTPDENALGKILAAISKARRDIRVQAYVFTDRTLARALIRAHRRGIAIEVIVDQEKVEDNGAPRAIELAAAGIPVYVDGLHAAAHNKIILIDAASNAPVVITGSYNFTVAAQSKNAENLLVIRGDRQIAAAYYRNWANHRGHATRIQ